MTHAHPARHDGRPRSAPLALAAVRAGFTLTEILVVITIIIIIIVIAVPAFQAMIYSNNRIQAEEGIKTGLALGRDSAVRGGDGQDGAAVFIYEPGAGCRIIACTKVGVLDDVDRSRTPNVVVQREVFVPVTAFAPVALPKNWVVRGFAPAGSVDSSWFETTTGNQRYPIGNPSWVFPETGFFDSALNNPDVDGLNRQTFMVRFEGGTGAVSAASPQSVLLVYPRDSRQNRMAPADLRLDTARDLVRTVRRILTDRVTPETATAIGRQRLLGEISGDCILVKPVRELALMDETRLAAALGARVDNTTGCLYRNTKQPQFVEATGPVAGGGTDVGVTAARISRWIEGDTNFDGQYTAGTTAQNADEPQAKVFVIDRFLGTAQQVALQRQGLNQ